MELATDNIMIEGLNKGEIVNFTGVKTLDELKSKIRDNYFT